MTIVHSLLPAGQCIASHPQNSLTLKQINSKFRFLDILERDPLNPRPDTSPLNSVKMVVSEEGIERWKTAINNRQSFVSFKKLEQLRPHMSLEQLVRLDKIMEMREKISKS